jgi:hypothetical protein
VLLVALAAALAAGCARSDADVSITTKVRAKLDADRIVTNPSAIQVTTNKKVVTLSGPVQTKEAEDQAVKLARSTDEVRNVVDQLTVTPGAAPPPPASQSPGAWGQTGETAGQPGGPAPATSAAAPSSTPASGR